MNMSEEVVVPAAAAIMNITKKPNTSGRRRRRKGRGIGGRGGDEDEWAADEDEDDADELDLHLWTERERRKKMKDMFSDLHRMLPHIPTKADKSTIVDEAVSYIQNLQVILQEFQRLKLQRNYIQLDQNNNNNNGILMMNIPPPSSSAPPPVVRPAAAVVQFETWCWPNVVLNVCGEQAQFSVCALKKPNISSSICFFFQKHNLHVLFCNLISNQSTCIYMIQAQAHEVLSKGSSSSISSSTHDHHHHLTYNDQQPRDDLMPYQPNIGSSPCPCPGPGPSPLEIFKRAALDITNWLSSPAAP